MRVMFLVGMPGSGKSTLAELVVKRMRKLKPKWKCRCVEMSDIVKGWLKETNGNNIWTTELKSVRLQQLLYKKIKGDFCVVSGVREQWIINEWKTAKATVFLCIEQTVRRERYRQCGKDIRSFESAEARAEQMRVPEMLRYAAVVIYFQYRSPSDTAEDIIKSVFNYGLTKFIREIEEPE